MHNQEAVAWIMAAEGSFTLQRVRNSLQPKISVNNTERAFIDEFFLLVGYGNRGVHTYNDSHPRWNTLYHWYIGANKDCLAFCSDVRDFMPIKHEQVDLLVEFCTRGIERGCGCKSCVGERDWEIYERLRQLNRRGKTVCDAVANG